MGAVLEYVQFKGDFIFVAGHCEEEAVFDGDGAVVGAVDQEAWRSIGCDLAVTGEQFDEGWVGVFAEEVVSGVVMLEGIVHCDNRVDQNGQVGARVELVDGVGGIGLSVVEMCGGAGGEMAAGGEADDADAFWVEIPFSCAGSD